MALINPFYNIGPNGLKTIYCSHKAQQKLDEHIKNYSCYENKIFRFRQWEKSALTDPPTEDQFYDALDFYVCEECRIKYLPYLK